jgi:hypothetical protein
VLQCAETKDAGSTRAAAGKSAKVMRGPGRMAYGLVEFELCDADGYRVCVSGHAPAGTAVKTHEE